MTNLERRRLGATDVEVTTLGFGGANLGNLYRAVADEQAGAVVNTAWDNGIRYFDTAPHYGLGLSERRLGAALGDRPRAEYVLSTKVGRLLVSNENATGSDMAHQFDVADDLRRELDYSGPGVRRSLEESLERLGVDHVDVAYVHDPDDFTQEVLDGALPELVRMRDEGIVRAVGVGMNQWQGPLRFVQESDLDVVMVAGRWTLLDRTGAPLLDACLERGVSVVSAAPFNSGLLARADPRAESHFNYETPDARLVQAARDLAALAREHGCTLPQVALQFPLRHAAVASVVAGLGKPDHAESAVRWLSQPVPEAFWNDADAIVEGLL
jgi:D-threo-aldose 1-dehydrogenase